MQVLKTSCKPKTRARCSTVASCCFICLEVIMMKIPHFLQPFIPSQDMAWNRLAVSFGMFIVGIIFVIMICKYGWDKVYISMNYQRRLKKHKRLCAENEKYNEGIKNELLQELNEILSSKGLILVADL